MSKLYVSSPAEEDFAQSLQWYTERSVTAATDFEAEFDDALSEIAQAPQKYSKLDEQHYVFHLRRFPFQVIYRLTGEDIEVIAVAHASRSVDFWRDR